MLKAVLFDLDDTLIDWSEFDQDQWPTLERHHLSGVHEFLKAEGHPVNDLDAYVHEYRTRLVHAWQEARGSMIAPHMGEILLQASEASGVPQGVLDTLRILEAYQWVAPNTVTAFPDALELLPMLHAHGIKVGIVTNAYQPMWIRDIEVKAHGIIDFFPDCRISAADIGYLKPHPAIFQAALECVGAEADEAIFVGDNPEADVAGAQASGIKAVLRIPRRTPPLLNGMVIPDATVNSLMELPAVMDEWFPKWRTQHA